MLKAPGYGFSGEAGPRLRHVVFFDRSASRKRALNLAPPTDDRADLISAARESRSTQSKHTPDEAAFIKWLFNEAGIDARSYGEQTLSRRLPSCLRVLRTPGVTQARELLQHKPALVPVAISNLIIGVTSFFRDGPVFDRLGDSILADIASSRNMIRVWSVGCSDGAELYSIAILLARIGALQRSELLGTDCRGDAVARARTGLYDASAIKDVPPDVLCKFFYRDGLMWRVDDPLRRLVKWRTANALTQNEPGPWDMILCRNLSMYLRGESAARLWQSIEPLLRPGGILVVGKAERPLGMRRMTMLAPCIFRRDWA